MIAGAAKISESDERVLFTFIGMSLTSWARMEEVMVVLVRLLLRTDRARAGLIMYSIINFNVWLTLIDDLFDHDPEFKSFKPRWTKIAERIRRIKDTRSHQIPAGMSSVPDRYLIPSKYDFRQKSQRYKPLTKTEIFAFMESVMAITTDLADFVEGMIDTYEASLKRIVLTSIQAATASMPRSYWRRRVGCHTNCKFAA